VLGVATTTLAADLSAAIKAVPASLTTEPWGLQQQAFRGRFEQPLKSCYNNLLGHFWASLKADSEHFSEGLEQQINGM
jgi:hypothetical protein